MSEVHNLTDFDELQNILADNARVVVKFTAPAWCAPCRQFAPVFEAVSELNPDTTFVAVDIDNANWATVEYGVLGVPTVALFENGQRVRDLKERTAVKFNAELTS